MANGPFFNNVGYVTEAGVLWSRVIQESYYDTGDGECMTHSEIWVGNVVSGASANITVCFNSNFLSKVADVCEYSGVTSIVVSDGSQGFCLLTNRHRNYVKHNCSK